MTIDVKFFASLREQVGQSDTRLNPEGSLTVAEVWLRATNIDMPENTLCAVNMEYVDRNQAVNDGDEVAFFPPVTGG